MAAFKPKFLITNEINKSLSQIEHSRGFLEGANLPEDWIRHMQEKAFLLEAHHTTHIEGTQLSIDQSYKIMHGKSVPDADPNDKQELLNYCDAFECVSTYLNDRKPITEGLIRHIHSLLVKSVRGNAASPGEYRAIQNYVVNSQTKEVIYTPPPAYDVPIMMQELIDWVNREEEIHPVLVAGIAQFQFVHIHPFLDGNGRSARLLSTLCLYKSGYDFKRLFTLSEFYDRERAKYYNAIQKVRENELDLTSWLEYFCHGLNLQLKEVETSSKEKLRLELESIQADLSTTQIQALSLAAEGSFTLNDLSKRCPEVSKRTLQRDLSHLQEIGLITVSGATRNRIYRLRK